MKNSPKSKTKSRFSRLTRREFLETSFLTAAGLAAGSLPLGALGRTKGAPGTAPGAGKPVVSIVRIKNDDIGYAVEKAIDLLGGIKNVTQGKQRIILKPNLVSPSPAATTKPVVIETLARLMKKAGKDVLIGEGSAAAPPFNVRGSEICRTNKREILDAMQQSVFDTLGYTRLASSLGVPLINLHSGEMVEVEVPNAFVFGKLTIHRTLADIDLLCSVPMMKTHQLAQVTLGMKNLVGLYPGTVYYAVRGLMHDRASEVEPSGTASAIVDMVRANKLGLVVVDGSMAMEGNGPSNGTLVKMDLIIAGTNPLAADMIAAKCMGFTPEEVPTFQWANKAGLMPARLSEIEIRGETPEQVGRAFVRPQVYAWKDIKNVWGAKII